MFWWFGERAPVMKKPSSFVMKPDRRIGVLADMIQMPPEQRLEYRFACLFLRYPRTGVTYLCNFSDAGTCMLPGASPPKVWKTNAAELNQTTLLLLGLRLFTL